MKRIYSLLAPLAVLVAAGTQVSAGPVDVSGPSAASPVVRGTYELTLHLSSARPVPSGASVVCKARVEPLLPGGRALNTQPAAVAAPGKNGTCSFQLPFWTPVDSQARQVSLSYTVEAVSDAGAFPLRQGSMLAPLSPDGTGRADVGVSY